jgi:outer membrane protein OmpA-like peptidoglycan-associated protein
MTRLVVLMTALILTGCSTMSPSRTSAGEADAHIAKQRALPLEPGVKSAIPIETRLPPVSAPAPRLATTLVPRTAPPPTPPRPTKTAPSTTTLSPLPCQTTAISGAGFAPNSWDLSATMRDLIADTVHRLTSGRYTSIHVVGHADSRPSPIGNDELSARRAESVALEMILDGIDPAIVYAEGHGDREPSAVGETGTAWAANRRIEILAFC